MISERLALFWTGERKMDAVDTAGRSLRDLVWDQLQRGGEFLPGLLAALLVFILGWAVARVARSGVRHLVLASNHLLSRIFPRGVLAGTRISTGAAALLGEVVFWLVLLIALTVAARVAGLASVIGWLDRVTAHLPNLIAGAAVIVVGYFLGFYVREQLAPAAAAATSPQQLLLARLAQAGVLTVAFIVGLDQVGIDVAVLVGVAVAAVAALAAGLAVAFALGARAHVGNLIGARVARQQLSEGLRVRIGDTEGEVLEVTATQIALNTDAGKALLPASCIDQGPVTILARDGGDSDRRV